ncbi:MAG: hypothetical protein Kow0025_07400 [Thermodesulfovibrionales bacterium]
MRKRIVVSAILLALVPLLGCGGSHPTYYISETVDFSYIERVAVLPFDNLTLDKSADGVVRHFVINELLVSGIVDVLPPGDVISAMNKLGVGSVSSLSSEQIKALGKALKVQGLIFGAVEQYGMVREGGVSAPQVTITMMMAEATEGSIIWSVTKTAGGAGFLTRHFGAKTDTLSQLTLEVVRDAVRTLAEY